MAAKKKKNLKKPHKSEVFNKHIERISTAVTEWMWSNSSLAVHTVLFSACFIAVWIGLISMDSMLAILTNIVSLEAIYLAIFIQMSVNKNTKSLQEVEKDIDEIQEDVEEIHENVEEIQEDVELIEQDVDKIEKDIDEIQEDVQEIEKDVDSIEKDVDELQEDVEEIQESVEEDAADETEDERREKLRDERIDHVVSSLNLIQKQLDVLFEEMKQAKQQNHHKK